MKVCGVIAEYNPFHNGHAYQLEYIRNSLGTDFIVVCMSGHFVQRGVPAVIDKYERTAMALENGADLVLELPAANACGSAEYFASGGVSVLDSLGVVDMLCFGCEDRDFTSDIFMKCAEIFDRETPEYSMALKDGLSRGMTFPEARLSAAEKILFGTGRAGNCALPDAPSITPEQLESLLSSPNNLLGIEYCLALLRRNSRITPCPVKRTGSEHASQNLSPDGFSSASAIRRALKGPELQEDARSLLSRSMPEHCCSRISSALHDNLLVFPEDFDSVLFYQLLKESEPDIFEYLDVSPDLGRRILSMRNRYRGFEDFAQLIKPRNYTLTRVQRSLLHILLSIKTASHDPGYARILGLRKSASQLLSEIKKKSRIPLVSRSSGFSVLSGKPLRDYLVTCAASDQYEAAVSLKSGRPFVSEYQKKIITV
ncbi:MAG: nucleotidyltransferase family protein [Blautia sp.]|nr:nucleotidyltransferase family protein [Blautia sp.]